MVMEFKQVLLQEVCITNSKQTYLPFILQVVTQCPALRTNFVNDNSVIES